jgi:hypothetical protein
MYTMKNRRTQKDPSRINEVPEKEPDIEPEDIPYPEIEDDPSMN